MGEIHKPTNRFKIYWQNNLKGAAPRFWENS